MSHRIKPIETEGVRVPTKWDRFADTLLDLEEAADLSEFDEDTRLADTMLQLQAA